MQLNQHTVTGLQKSGLITSRISTDIPWPSQDSPVTQKRGILPPSAGGEWCRVTNPVYSVINEITAGGEKDSHVESHLRNLWLWKEMICQSDDCLTWKALIVWLKWGIFYLIVLKEFCWPAVWHITGIYRLNAWFCFILQLRACWGPWECLARMGVFSSPVCDFSFSRLLPSSKATGKGDFMMIYKAP